jgi:hypothetical protein
MGDVGSKAGPTGNEEAIAANVRDNADSVAEHFRDEDGMVAETTEDSFHLVRPEASRLATRLQTSSVAQTGLLAENGG